MPDSTNMIGQFLGKRASKLSNLTSVHTIPQPLSRTVLDSTQVPSCPISCPMRAAIVNDYCNGVSTASISTESPANPKRTSTISPSLKSPVTAGPVTSR